MLSQLDSSLNVVKALNLETPLHKLLLSQLVLERTEKHSHKVWKIRSSNQQFTRLAELHEFLEDRCKALELIKLTELSEGTYSMIKNLL